MNIPYKIIGVLVIGIAIGIVLGWGWGLAQAVIIYEGNPITTPHKTFTPEGCIRTMTNEAHALTHIDGIGTTVRIIPYDLLEVIVKELNESPGREILFCLTQSPDFILTIMESESYEGRATSEEYCPGITIHNHPNGSCIPSVGDVENMNGDTFGIVCGYNIIGEPTLLHMYEENGDDLLHWIIGDECFQNKQEVLTNG